MRQLLMRLFHGVALCLSLLTGLAYAASCANPGATTVFFVNGVWNPPGPNAPDSLNALEALMTSPSGFSAYDFQLANNPGDGLITDLIETYGQTVGVNADWAMFSLWLAGEVVTPDFLKVISPLFTSSIVKLALPTSQPPQKTQDVLRQHVAQYRSALQSGRKVVVVAHSQGNYFANAAVESVVDGLTFAEQQSFTIVSVANPDDHIATASRSNIPVTLKEDLIIGEVVVKARKLFGLAPPMGFAPPNDVTPYTNIPGINDDILKHDFASTYLQRTYRPRDSRALPASELAILNNIDAAARATPSPPCQQSPFIIQPGPGQGKDIWTTSVFSNAPGGGGPGGGLDNDELRVGGWGDLYYSLLQFDISNPSLPKQAKSAVLRLYNHLNQGNGPTPMTLYQITQFWNWKTQGTGSDRLRLWWADQPTAVQLGATAQRPAVLPAPPLNAFYDVDITDLYNFWQSNPTQNFGLELRPTLNNNYWNIFLSSDYLTDPSLRPQLIITAP